jgi:hypothetical protein
VTTTLPEITVERLERLAGILCRGSVTSYNYWRKNLFDLYEIASLPKLPRAGESAAIAFDHDLKVASLFFDRVAYNLFEPDPPPDEIAMYGGTSGEIWPFILAMLLKEDDPDPASTMDTLIERVLGDPTEFEDEVANLGGTTPARVMCNAFYVAHGIVATPIYSSAESRDAEFQPGSSELVIAAIRNLNVANDEALTWKQVLEFRRDKEAAIKLRRLKNWLDRDMTGKPISFVSDAIATKLYDYEWAIKKHGIKTITGTISQLLDPKLLGTVAATAGGLLLAGQEFFAALAGAGILVGRAAVSITDKLVDLRDSERGPNAEVAFVHDIKRKGKKRGRSRKETPKDD